jgi:hypothetical protein
MRCCKADKKSPDVQDRIVIRYERSPAFLYGASLFLRLNSAKRWHWLYFISSQITDFKETRQNAGCYLYGGCFDETYLCSRPGVDISLYGYRRRPDRNHFTPRRRD